MCARNNPLTGVLTQNGATDIGFASTGCSGRTAGAGVKLSLKEKTMIINLLETRTEKLTRHVREHLAVETIVEDVWVGRLGTAIDNAYKRIWAQLKEKPNER